MSKKSAQCRRCGVEIEPREDRLGFGFCYVCAPVFSPTRPKTVDSTDPWEAA